MFIESILALLLVVFLMSLVFSYSELFGEMPEDPPILLTEKELEMINELKNLRQKSDQ